MRAVNVNPMANMDFILTCKKIENIATNQQPLSSPKLRIKTWNVLVVDKNLRPEC